MKNNIAFYRKKKKMNQKELSEKLGISRQYISQLENGHYNMSVGLSLKMAAALKIRVEKLFEVMTDELEEIKREDREGNASTELDESRDRVSGENDN